MVGGILHFLKHYTFLHLTDIFFLNNTHQMLKCVVDLIWIELIALTDTFA